MNTLAFNDFEAVELVDLAAVEGGDFGDFLEATGEGAAIGGAGGLVTGGVSGAMAGWIAPGPGNGIGAVGGAAIGGASGFVGGAVTGALNYLF
ncbi:hypothetical protein ACVR1G_03600 [Streptococcus dentasini]